MRARTLKHEGGCGKYIGRFYSCMHTFFIDAETEEELREYAKMYQCDLIIVEVKNLDPHENGRLKRTSIGSYMQNQVLSNIFEDNWEYKK